jgi:branched-chain amino acid transport system ATP-binding protein
VLRAEEVQVSFGGVRALSDASIEARAGEVTGLIGPNGAGKTTLFNVLTGLQKPDRGRVLMDDRDITGLRPWARGSLGIGRTFQRLELFGSLTALENILVPLEARTRPGRRKGCRPAAMAVLERVGIEAYSGKRADTLPTGIGRLLELARAIASDPKVLLLDEGSAGLDADESRNFGKLIGQLAEDGVAVLLVEHDMELVMAICRKIYVLDFGQIIETGSPAEVASSPRVQAAYLGVDHLGGDAVASGANGDH